MQLTSNTVFITGGGSGIGRGLAEAFHKLGNQVLIGGRREDVLKKTCAANPGMRSFVLDVTDLDSIRKIAAQVTSEFPKLNCVFNNAGIQRFHDFSAERPIDDQVLQQEIATNLLGVIRVSGEFLPHLKKKSGATLINVSSGLAFVPLSRFPVYCATKAAVHSFSLSLRNQLRSTSVKVIEIVPPYVATDLGGPRRPAGAPTPMPLDEFIAETMKELAGDGEELAIAEAKSLTAAVSSPVAKQIFARMNGG